MTYAKTKAQLVQEIERNKAQICELKHELETANRIENKDKAATELHEMYESYIKAGFSDEQAWEITKIIINNSTTKRGLF